MHTCNVTAWVRDKMWVTTFTARVFFFFLKEDSRIENYYQLIVLNRWKMSSIGVIWFWKNVFWANVLSGGRIRGKCLEIIWNSLVLRRVLSQNNYRRRSVYNWFVCSHLTVCFFFFLWMGFWHGPCPRYRTNFTFYQCVIR